MAMLRTACGNVFFVCLVFCYLLPGCRASDYRPIAEGEYLSISDSKEVIVVSSTEMEFYVKVDEKYIKRKYKYTVLSDGEIQPFPFVSTDLVSGVGRFDWFWDGKNIVKRDPNTGRMYKFSKE